MKRTNPLKTITTFLLITLIAALIAIKTPLTTTLASGNQSLSNSPLTQIHPVISPKLDRASGQSLPGSPSESKILSNENPRINQSSSLSSSNQAGIKEIACAKIWNAYPQGGYAVPDWLYTPTKASDLQTNEPYTYLAGKLLSNSLATAPNCPYNGMLPTGFSSQCGLEAIRSQVNSWQNQFDQGIYNSAVKNAVPARLLKNIFAQESQFWLGQSDDNQHFGLAQITEGGLDPLFLAYPEYYQLVCSDVLSTDTCKSKYAELSNQNKGLIRGYFLRSVIDASCPECPKKFNEKKAVDTIDVFARLVIANCEQVSRVIIDITERTPGTISTYDDLWRYTMVNYNAGSGCVSGAIEKTYKLNEPLDWSHVSDNMSNRCNNALDYVEKVSR